MIDDAKAFRMRLRELQQNVQHARESEDATRKGLARCRAARIQAEQALRTCLEEDLRGLPLFDREEPVETAQPESEPPASKPVKLDGIHLALVEPGAKEIADLSARLGYPCKVWMASCGDYYVLFDALRFGNWDRDNLPSDQYKPTAGDVMHAAILESKLPFTNCDGTEPIGAFPKDDIRRDRLWGMSLYIADKDHPELWRLKLLTEFGQAGSILSRSSVYHVGQVAALIESGRALTTLPKVTEQAAIALLSEIKKWWATTPEGVRGDRPAWLASWDEPEQKPKREGKKQ